MKALLVNPYIYDFAAYNYWSAPLGLLYIGAILRKNHIDVDLIDCLTVDSARIKPDGRGPFLKEVTAKPTVLSSIKRRFRRYGVSRETFMEGLIRSGKPDVVLVTTVMTYWYYGAKEVIDTIREVFPETRIIVGGIYATLCNDHARKVMTGADLIVRNNDMASFYNFIEDALNYSLRYKPCFQDIESLPYPCFDLYDNIPFVPLLTSFGCPYRCAYCATPFLYPFSVRRSPKSVIDEITFWHNRGVNRFAIYDDSFLFKSDLYAKPILNAISRLPFSVSIYNPNALNAALIDREAARLICLSGFKEVRFGLETVDPSAQKSTGGKIDSPTFERAVGHLSDAGFPLKSIGAYILSGLPLQKWEDVMASIDYLSGLGIKTYIAEYTPIPRTPLFEQHSRHARFPLDEPLFQNNAVFPFAWEGFTEDDLSRLKHYARDKNSTIDNSP